MKLENAKPLFSTEYLEYVREEKKGFLTIISKNHPEVKELVINCTSKEILSLCDGEKTFDEILKHMGKKYFKVEKDLLKRDLIQVLGNMSRLGVISWKTENPFLFTRENFLDNQHCIRIATEDDIRDLCGYLSSLKNEDKDIKYISPYSTDKEYSELAIRQKLFAYAEEFILLVENKKIVGLLALKIPSAGVIKAASIRICALNKGCKENLTALFAYAFDVIPYASVMPMNKIEFYKDESDKQNEILELLEKDNYFKEGVLKNQIELGQNIEVWGRSFTTEELEKINKYRNQAC